MNDSQPPKIDPGPSPKRMLYGFVAAGSTIVVIGLVVVLVLALNDSLPGDSPSSQEGPQEDLPPLAEACPPPTSSPPEEEPPSTDNGDDRTVDKESGISYKKYGDPWQTWNQQWNAGELSVEYGVGQSFVTEQYSQGEYLASVLSGHVPAAVNDGTQLDLECVSDQVVGDVRSNYYPQPTKAKKIRDEEATLGGRPAWLQIFRLSFQEEGLKADGELVGVGLVDVGKADAAVLYVSIPNTEKKYDDVVEEALESIRVAK